MFQKKERISQQDLKRKKRKRVQKKLWKTKTRRKKIKRSLKQENQK